MTDFRANVIVKLLDRVTRPARQIRQSLKRLGQIQAFRNLAVAFRNVGASLGNVARQAGKLGKTALFGGGLLGGGLLLGLQQAAGLGDRIAKTADRLQIGVGALQEFRFAADRSGISVQAFDSSLERFVKRVGEASKGAGEAGRVLRFLGVELKTSNGEMRDTEDLLMEVLGALGGLDDAATQAAAAAAIFGREGLAMVNLAAEGAGGIEALRTEARRFGVMSEETARKSEDFVDQMTNLKAAVNGLKFAVAGELLPAISGLLRNLTEWIVANRAVIAPKVVEFTKQLGQALLSIGAVAATVFGALQSIADLMGTWTPIIVAVTAAVAGPFVLALKSLAVILGSLLLPVLKAIAAALLANPIGLVVAALAAGALLLITNWEAVSAFFKQLWSDLTAGVRVFLLITQFLWKSIKQGISDFVDDIVAGIKAFDPVTLMRRAINEVIAFLSSIDLVQQGINFISSFWRGVRAVAIPDSVARFFGLGDTPSGGAVAVPSLAAPVPIGPAASGGFDPARAGRTSGGARRIVIEGRNLPAGAQFEVTTDSPDLEIDAGLTLEVMP